jgi:TfoX/Sxy family transcriptional regulator of competence genes
LYGRVVAYDEELAFRLRAAVETVDGITSKRMFGGMAFLLHGHMAVAASSKGNLMVRIDPVDLDDTLAKEHAVPMVMGGREMAGWVRVVEPGYDTDAALQSWVDQGLAYASTLPPK